MSSPHYRRALDRIAASEPFVFGQEGRLPIDLQVGMHTRYSPSKIVGAIAHAFPEAFEQIPRFLDRPSLLVLQAIPGYWVFGLADPAFNPAASIFQSLEDDSVLEALHAAPIAAALNLENEIITIKQGLGRIDPDTAKALWACLSFVEAADLTESEIRGCGWWSPAFITAWHEARGSYRL